MPRLPVVVAQKLRGDCWAPGFEKDLCFDQAGGAAIAIPEWMDPCEVQMAKNRTEDGENDAGSGIVRLGSRPDGR